MLPMISSEHLAKCLSNNRCQLTSDIVPIPTKRDSSAYNSTEIEDGP